MSKILLSLKTKRQPALNRLPAFLRRLLSLKKRAGRCVSPRLPVMFPSWHYKAPCRMSAVPLNEALCPRVPPARKCRKRVRNFLSSCQRTGRANWWRVSAGTSSIEVRLENRTGNPVLSLRPGDGLPVPNNWLGWWLFSSGPLVAASTRCGASEADQFSTTPRRM